jgi:Rrf2 family protein
LFTAARSLRSILFKEIDVKISTRTDYALRIMLSLTFEAHSGEPQRLPDLARKNGIPLRFLEQIMIRLKAAGLVESRRGRRGGYLVGRDPDKVTMGEILRVMDGPIVLRHCMNGRSSIEPCPNKDGCVFREVFGKVKDEVQTVINNVTLRELSQKARGRGLFGDRNPSQPVQ